MRRLTTSAFVILGVLGLLGACTDDETPSSPATQACVPGASIACVGAGGCSGGQACKADGSGYADCVCGNGNVPPSDSGTPVTPQRDASDGAPPITPTTGGQRFTWTLKKGGTTTTCSAVGADSVAVLYTKVGTVDSIEKKLPCTPGEGTTTDLAFGAYKVRVSAVNAAGQGLGPESPIDVTFAETPCDSIAGTSCIRNVAVTLTID